MKRAIKDVSLLTFIGACVLTTSVATAQHLGHYNHGDHHHHLGDTYAYDLHHGYTSSYHHNHLAYPIYAPRQLHSVQVYSQADPACLHLTDVYCPQVDRFPVDSFDSSCPLGLVDECPLRHGAIGFGDIYGRTRLPASKQEHLHDDHSHSGHTHGDHSHGHASPPIDSDNGFVPQPSLPPNATRSPTAPPSPFTQPQRLQPGAKTRSTPNAEAPIQMDGPPPSL